MVQDTRDSEHGPGALEDLDVFEAKVCRLSQFCCGVQCIVFVMECLCPDVASRIL